MIWKQTYSGRAVDMLAPTPDDIDFGDIAHALALINRFDGHTREPYGVAQHCVMGAEAIMAETGDRRLAALFLLHDAHEAYVGDIGTPMQMALAVEAPEARAALRLIRDRFDGAIHAAAGLALPDAGEAARIKVMDIRMLRAERDALMVVKPQDWTADVEAAAPIAGLGSLRPWHWRPAEDRWIRLLPALCPAAAVIRQRPARPAYNANDFADVPDTVLCGLMLQRGYTIDAEDGPGDVFDEPEFEHAADYLRRGDVAEALIWLERALPDRFAGLATAAFPASSR